MRNNRVGKSTKQKAKKRNSTINRRFLFFCYKLLLFAFLSVLAFSFSSQSLCHCCWLVARRRLYYTHLLSFFLSVVVTVFNHTVFLLPKFRGSESKLSNHNTFSNWIKSASIASIDSPSSSSLSLLSFSSYLGLLSSSLDSLFGEETRVTVAILVAFSFIDESRSFDLPRWSDMLSHGRNLLVVGEMWCVMASTAKTLRLSKIFRAYCVLWEHK